MRNLTNEDYKIRILKIHADTGIWTDVENVRVQANIGNWMTAKAILMELALGGFVTAEKTSKSRIFRRSNDSPVGRTSASKTKKLSGGQNL